MAGRRKKTRQANLQGRFHTAAEEVLTRSRARRKAVADQRFLRDRDPTANTICLPSDCELPWRPLAAIPVAGEFPWGIS